MQQKEQELLSKKEQLEFDVLEKEATLLRLEVEQIDFNLHIIGEIVSLKNILLYIKKYREALTVEEVESFRNMDGRMKEIIKVQDGQVMVDEEALEAFIEEIENQINLT
ncbi:MULTISPECIES: hypothetical protein [Bacillus amyloliquefaciens group]|uniref:hypothetical protein n=1 Tax=Bacillus amyloliquefaciens group TaxID=1938374 RepID=UPI0002059849|nr:hypothetical protein [Bacillus amyloliquefaciens]AIW34007.1 hypothetical protein KS08_10265 [Bacillus subtilis]AEB23554.1 hypothetical protein BAMTA208_06895 [Bacillus amyloliquefaciens TA208]AEK88540.1 hypothetical protein BAXH7_01402 [Bacillus amyloliquefaciens XH7]MEC0967204.1 hypothetical protein [Bacillus amyloliquefaciens]MEC1832720.1 hypothetical protein [Bacillus amyloliquefaciens]